jgi:hypothetical protein
MNLKILNRIRSGKRVMAEIPHDDPNLRKWIIVDVARPRHPLDPSFEALSHQYEARVIERPRHEHELDFYEESPKLLVTHRFKDEEALVEELPKLMPSTDLLDLPSRVYVPLSSGP